MAYVDTSLEIKFRECYDKALRAKNSGNLLLAKSKFHEAADILDKQVALCPEEVREQKRQLSQRIRNIANAINSPTQQNNNHYKNYPSYNNQVNQNTPKIDPNNAFNVSPLVGETQQTESNDNTDDLSSFFTFYNEEDLELGFDDVIGLDDAKYSITQYVINPIKYPEAYHYNFANNKAILLYGPPGTGKTTFAKALAKEINQPFALVNVAALVNCYIGETAKNIDSIFKYFRDYVEKNNKAITIFFDEFDEIAKKRSSDDKTASVAVPALLRNMDGIKKNKGFLILANTNCPDDLDEGILSRFRQKILVDLPNKEARMRLFIQKLAEVEDEYADKLDFDKLSEVSEGLSGRDINDICDDFKYELSAFQAGIKSIDNFNDILIDFIEKKK